LTNKSTNIMTSEILLIKRTKQFTLRIIKVVDALLNNIAGRVIGNQLVKCGTSVGANYRQHVEEEVKQNLIQNYILYLKKLMKVYFGLS
jgi:four helix bundle protein